MNKKRLKVLGCVFFTYLFFMSNIFYIKACVPKSVKDLLKIALKPVGSTLYIYGGGWNKKDDGAGKSAKTIGLCPEWKNFYDKQNASYDFKKHDYEIENGLDCTGYMGWVLYNYLEKEGSENGYVIKSSKMAQELENKGLGIVTRCDKIGEDYRPGDIMASRTKFHVYMVLGKCDDGSVLLLNSSPPGVSICGTIKRDGDENSEAIRLARFYMEKYYFDYQEKFCDRKKDMCYLYEFDRFRFNSRNICDPDGYFNCSIKDMLEDLFSDINTKK